MEFQSGLKYKRTGCILVKTIRIEGTMGRMVMEFQSGLTYKRTGCILVKTVRSRQDSLTIADADRKIYPKITPICFL
jgi:hypothetical protein